MLNNSFFKRIIPFALTFTLGLFVASFFVSIIPTFKFKKNCCGRRQQVQKLKYENERLGAENQRLKMKLEETERMILLEESVPSPPPVMARQK